MKTGEIAQYIGGKLHGSQHIEIKEIARIDTAKKGELTWFANDKYKKWLNTTKASCIIVPAGTTSSACTIEVKTPLIALSKLLLKFYPEVLPSPTISKTAKISKAAKIGKNVFIGDFSSIGENTIISDNVVILDNVHIYRNVKIGVRTQLHTSAVIKPNSMIGKNVIIGAGTVIGNDGFAYTRIQGKYQKLPHRGRVVIEDEVEIGANCTIDRALVGATLIKKGTKIDNLVHIAHNVIIGENSIIVAQVGIAGSVQIGSNVTIAGQAGIPDHVKVGDNVTIAAQAGLIGDIPAGITVSGYPARPHMESNRAYSLMLKLPELFKRVKTLEEKCRQQ